MRLEMREMSTCNPSQAGEFMRVQVSAMRLESPDVLSMELRDFHGLELPPAPPGSHIDVSLREGLTRPYSVVRGDKGTYVLAVKRESSSRGGSAHVHERLRVGDVIQVSKPHNHFALAEGTGPCVLIAGGIGITPLLPMVRALERAGRPWRLHYAAKDIAKAPFARELRQLGERVIMHCSQTAGRLDLAKLVANAEAETHFYCCGPASMLDDFAEATRAVEPARVHTERFGPAALPADSSSFEVQLAKSAQRIVVGSDISILDALLQSGVNVDYSCRQGICGACEVRVLEGVADHRDEILTDAERSSNKTMMVCCSRARSRTLVLDL